MALLAIEFLLDSQSQFAKLNSNFGLEGQEWSETLR